MAVWSIVKVSELEGAKRLDAEYYQPKYVEAVSSVVAYGKVKTLTDIARVLRGRNPARYTESGVPVIRAVDLRDITDLDNVQYASSQERLFYLVEQDILISSIGAGSIGKVELFTGSNGKAATVSEVSVVRVKKGTFNPAALAVFLRSRYGYLQLERRITGSTGQLHLYPKDIGTVVVPMLGEDIQQQIANDINNSMGLLEQSKSLYLQAERMVLEELGWDEFDLSQPKWWAVSLSRAREVRRLDAEHFQPKYDNLIAHLKKTGRVKRIHDLLSEPIQKGVTPDYDPAGSIVAVNSQHLGRCCLNFEVTDRTTETFWQSNRRAQMHPNDVMIYATGAYIGRANAYLETARALAGVDILLLRPTGECSPLYLAVFLNAPPGLMQSRRFASGSGQAHIYPKDVFRYWVYLPSENFQLQVADLVRQSYQARRKAKALIHEAIEKGETLVESETK